MNRWTCTACKKEIVVQSIKVALVVGTLLVAINYGEKFLAGGIRRGDVFRIILTYFVPYGVSTYASVQAILRRENQ